MASPAVFLPALMCGGGMAACMWLMSRGHKASKDPKDPGVDAVAPGRDTEVAELREELERLRAEVRSRDEQRS